MPIDPVSMGIAAGVNVAAPMIAKGIGSLFGLDEDSSEERRAAQRRQEAIDRLTAAAEGRTASAAQLAAQAQQQRTQQALQSLAQRGSVQQRAGNTRAAMQAAPEIMAQQGAQIAATRAAEMESARNALAQAQMGIANQEAAQGAAKRQYMQRLIGAGVQGAATAATMGMKADEPKGSGGGGGGGGGGESDGDFGSSSQGLQVDQQFNPMMNEAGQGGQSLQFGPKTQQALLEQGYSGPNAREMNFEMTGDPGYGELQLPKLEVGRESAQRQFGAQPSLRNRLLDYTEGDVDERPYRYTTSTMSGGRTLGLKFPGSL